MGGRWGNGYAGGLSRQSPWFAPESSLTVEKKVRKSTRYGAGYELAWAKSILVSEGGAGVSPVEPNIFY